MKNQDKWMEKVMKLIKEGKSVENPQNEKPLLSEAQLKKIIENGKGN